MWGMGRTGVGCMGFTGTGHMGLTGIRTWRPERWASCMAEGHLELDCVLGYHSIIGGGEPPASNLCTGSEAPGRLGEPGSTQGLEQWHREATAGPLGAGKGSGGSRGAHLIFVDPACLARPALAQVRHGLSTARPHHHGHHGHCHALRQSLALHRPYSCRVQARHSLSWVEANRVAWEGHRVDGASRVEASAELPST